MTTASSASNAPAANAPAANAPAANAPAANAPTANAPTANAPTANANEKVAAEIKPFPSPVPLPATGAPATEDKAAPAAPVIASSTAEPALQSKPKRRFSRVMLMAVVPLALLAGGGYVWVTGGRYQDTENANLRQARVSIISEASGRIVETKVTDNLTVKTGDVLFVVDPEPYRIALAQADASIAAARLNVAQLRAAYSQALAQEKNAGGDVSYFQSELERQSALSKKGVSTLASLDSARRDLMKAQDNLTAATEAVAGARAALGGDPAILTDKHPTVLAALAARDKAGFDLSQTSVKAPADGVVYQASSFKLGQFVAAGTPVFALVETNDSWVDANFKETQLTHMKIGQEAEITVDAFPDTPIKATVEAIGAGTGAEFSVLPAQNATGNWVKVTQRIPVRLKVDPSEMGPMLRTGMSASVSVDTGKSRGFGPLFGQAVAAE